MITCRAALLVLTLVVSPGGLAEEQSQTQVIEPQPWARGTPSIPDVPAGFPYNVGAVAGESRQTDVPLRDYMSSRVDQLRSEMLDRLELLDRQQKQLMDERDRQYAQRFGAQQEALVATLTAAEKSVAAALASAKEAVTKAENAANDRFESVNEFRQTLSDQTRSFVSKDAFDALEKQVNNNTSRLDQNSGADRGEVDTWAWIIALVAVLFAAGSFVLNYNRQQKALLA